MTSTGTNRQLCLSLRFCHELRPFRCKPETRNPKPETRNPKPETRNPKPELLTPNPSTQAKTQGATDGDVTGETVRRLLQEGWWAVGKAEEEQVSKP
jgi:hypothetical protein